MANRPNFIDVRPDSRGSPIPDLPSPRAGEIPPALSPLDALALQGRLLAKRFEEQNKQGKRMSRLAPLTIQNEFGRARPGFFRSISEEGHSAVERSPRDLGFGDDFEDHTPRSAKETNPDSRPKSHYPLFQTDDSPVRDSSYQPNLTPLEEGTSGSPPSHDYFAIPRTASPDQIDIHKRPSNDALYPPRGDSVYASPMESNTLRPPRSPVPQRSPRSPRAPSIRSVPGDSSDAEGTSMGGSMDSLPRKLSTNSSYSRSHSPCSPMAAPLAIPRSPSISSEYSMGGTRLARPAYNFSRPLSTQPSFDSKPWSENQYSEEQHGLQAIGTPTRENSHDSSFMLHDVHTPVSMTSDEYIAAQDFHNQPAPSYIYSKYALPRGRTPKRESMDAYKFMNQFFKEEGAARRPPSPPSPIRQKSEHTLPIRGASMDQGRGRMPSTPTSATGSSNATLRPRTAQTIADMSPEEHLEQGIQCHEAGSLQKSTYHLRLAARAGHPTGMLLYALACRHGWGMRQNEAEGFQWLKKAVDSAQLDVAEDEDQTKQGKAMDVNERRTHKARFALGIYELGKSYMEGWGVQQDRALALRCFEIAGNWGDADALTEAGYCYAEGLGCKKDLKKAAKFYRDAAAKGASMVGQSWIYKEKYMDGNDEDGRSARPTSRKDNAEKKPRDKSRTRTIFGRKKSTTQ